MIHVPSRLPGESFSLYHLEETMKPLGYVINGNWDYDHGYFDYKIDNRDGYTFLRVPFTAEKSKAGSARRCGENGRSISLKACISR